MSDLDVGDPSHCMQVSRVAPDGPAPVNACVHHA